MKEVTLNEIIDIENMLLMIEDKYIYDLSFNNILTLDKFLGSFGEITNRYFTILNDYKAHIDNFMPNLTKKEKQDLFTKYNSNINRDILDYDITSCLIFIKEICLHFTDKDIDEKLKSFF